MKNFKTYIYHYDAFNLLNGCVDYLEDNFIYDWNIDILYTNLQNNYIASGINFYNFIDILYRAVKLRLIYYNLLSSHLLRNDLFLFELYIESNNKKKLISFENKLLIQITKLSIDKFVYRDFNYDLYEKLLIYELVKPAYRFIDGLNVKKINIEFIIYDIYNYNKKHKYQFEIIELNYCLKCRDSVYQITKKLFNPNIYYNNVYEKNVDDNFFQKYFCIEQLYKR